MTTAIEEVRSFPEEGDDTIPEALKLVQEADHSALYGPEFGQERIKNPYNSNLKRRHQTLTGLYFGRTKRGTPVVIGANRPHYLTDPENIVAAIKYGLINGAAAMPEIAEEIQRLLALEGENVLVEDYETWERAESGLFSLTEGAKQPAARLILGGRVKAEEYMDGFQKRNHRDQIGVWKSNDFGENSVARLAVYGDFGVDYGLGANYHLDDGAGRFAGRRQGLEARL